MPAETLVILSKNRSEYGLGPAAAEDQMLSTKKTSRKRGKDSAKPSKPGHTSEHVKAQRKLHRETSRLVKAGHAFPDALPDDSRQFNDFAPVPEEEKKWLSLHHFEDEGIVLEDKESQVGSASWAGSRKPICANNNCNKRLAADMAASMLRAEMQLDMDSGTCTASS